MWLLNLNIEKIHMQPFLAVKWSRNLAVIAFFFASGMCTMRKIKFYFTAGRMRQFGLTLSRGLTKFYGKISDKWPGNYLL